jgi:monoamine oxidase
MSRVNGKRVTDDFEVLVIGGGAAGIGAAQKLAHARVSYLIVEARPRLGGRAWTVADEFPLDLGCGWLHSANVNPWTRLAEAQGLSIDKTPPPWTRPSTPIGFPLDEQRAFSKAMEIFYKRLDQSRDAPDAPASTLLEGDCRWNPLIDAVSTYTNGVELGRLSTRDFAYYEDTKVNWRVAEGYGALIVSAAAGLNAVLDCPVIEIDHGGARLQARTPKGTIRADAIIVTVTSALLAEERLRFTPALLGKAEAAASLPLGLANKLFLSLEGAEEFEADSRIFGSTERTATAAYHMRPFGRPMIEAYFGGRLADDLEGEGAKAFVDFASYELTALLGASFASRIRPLHVSQWRKDPFALGAYSYALPGHHGDRAGLAAPVDGRLFFAGEACSVERFSTAHGAYLSGCDAAAQAFAALERIA